MPGGDDALLQTIAENCADPQFNVSALAEKLGRSASYLYEQAHSKYGMSIQQLIETVRLEQAIKLLSKDGSKIEVVRKQVGYQYAKTFRTAFKRRLKSTPQQYKDRLLRADGKGLEIKQLVIQLWEHSRENNL